MNLPRSAAIRRRLRGAAGGGGAASNVRKGESETNVIIKDVFGPLLRKGAAAPLPASTSSRATLPRWRSTLYASPRHLTAPPRKNTAQARRVRDMVRFDWSVGFTPLSLSFFHLTRGGLHGEGRRRGLSFGTGSGVAEIAILKMFFFFVPRTSTFQSRR